MGAVARSGCGAYLFQLLEGVGRRSCHGGGGEGVPSATMMGEDGGG